MQTLRAVVAILDNSLIEVAFSFHRFLLLSEISFSTFFQGTSGQNGGIQKFLALSL